MKQELAPESKSGRTCIGGVILVLTMTWAKNTLLTCFEGMEPLMGCTDLGLSNQTAPILAGLSRLTLLLRNSNLFEILGLLVLLILSNTPKGLLTLSDTPKGRIDSGLVQANGDIYGATCTLEPKVDTGSKSSHSQVD